MITNYSEHHSQHFPHLHVMFVLFKKNFWIFLSFLAYKLYKNKASLCPAYLLCPQVWAEGLMHGYVSKTILSKRMEVFY